jgi:hypothetical protein
MRLPRGGSSLELRNLALMVDMVLDQSANERTDRDASSRSGVALICDPPHEVSGLEDGDDLLDFLVSGAKIFQR